MKKEHSDNTKGTKYFSKAQPRSDLRDLRFDLTLTIREDKLEAVANALDVKFPERKRQRSAEQEKKHRRQLGAIFANGLQGREAKLPVFYPRNHAAYRGDTPSWYSADTVPKSMDALANAGYIRDDVAEAGITTKSQSTYTFLQAGSDFLTCAGVSAADIEVVPADHRFIIIRDANGMPLRLDRSNDIIAMKIANAEEINEFISSFEISYISAPVPYLNQEEIYRVPIKTRAARIYNLDLVHGGRFFRCFWHNITKAERKTMWIGACKTVELDYGALFARMGYHDQGIASPIDPYDIPDLRRAAEKQDRDYAKVRTPVKRLMQTGINSPREMKFYNWKFAGLNDIYIKQANEWIWEANRSIAHLANSSSGLSMMTWESDLAERIMLNAARAGIPVLSVHDSFIVREQDEGWLREKMIQVYYERFSFLPIIK